MACIRKRRGKWVADYYDFAKVRRWITCDTKREAEEQLDARLKETKLLTGAAVCGDPDITVKEFFDQWIQKVALTSKPRTAETYADYFRLHILPEFGEMKVRDLHRPRIKRWLVEKLGSKSKGTVRLIIKILRAFLGDAMEDSIIATNPAAKLGRSLKVEGKGAKQSKPEPKAFAREQLERFLDSAHNRWYEYFLFMARTGCRLGESLALTIDDVNLTEGTVTVNKSYGKGATGTPKDNESREVDLSKHLTEVLRQMIARRREEHFAAGKPMESFGESLLFATENGSHLKATYITRAIERTLSKAGLDIHFSVHCFRHTYASQLLQMGISPAYVQRQLGHSTIGMTVDTYGKWLPAGRKGVVDCLDEVSPASEVQEG